MPCTASRGCRKTDGGAGRGKGRGNVLPDFSGLSHTGDDELAVSDMNTVMDQSDGPDDAFIHRDVADRMDLPLNNLMYIVQQVSLQRILHGLMHILACESGRRSVSS